MRDGLVAVALFAASLVVALLALHGAAHLVGIAG